MSQTLFLTEKRFREVLAKKRQTLLKRKFWVNMGKKDDNRSSKTPGWKRDKKEGKGGGDRKDNKPKGHPPAAASDGDASDEGGGNRAATDNGPSTSKAPAKPKTACPKFDGVHGVSQTTKDLLPHEDPTNRKWTRQNMAKVIEELDRRYVAASMELSRLQRRETARMALKQQKNPSLAEGDEQNPADVIFGLQGKVKFLEYELKVKKQQLNSTKKKLLLQKQLNSSYAEARGTGAADAAAAGEEQPTHSGWLGKTKAQLKQFPPATPPDPLDVAENVLMKSPHYGSQPPSSGSSSSLHDSDLDDDVYDDRYERLMRLREIMEGQKRGKRKVNEFILDHADEKPYGEESPEQPSEAESDEEGGGGDSGGDSRKVVVVRPAYDVDTTYDAVKHEEAVWPQYSDAERSDSEEPGDSDFDQLELEGQQTAETEDVADDSQSRDAGSPASLSSSVYTTEGGDDRVVAAHGGQEEGGRSSRLSQLQQILAGKRKARCEGDDHDHPVASGSRATENPKDEEKKKKDKKRQKNE